MYYKCLEAHRGLECGLDEGRGLRAGYPLELPASVSILMYPFLCRSTGDRGSLFTVFYLWGTLLSILDLLIVSERRLVVVRTELGSPKNADTLILSTPKSDLIWKEGH